MSLDHSNNVAGSIFLIYENAVKMFVINGVLFVLDCCTEDGTDISGRCQVKAI